jgi:hypothetical protein
VDPTTIGLSNAATTFSSTRRRPHRAAGGLEVCGPLKVALHAASSAIDTDWTAKLLGVHPDGYA